MKKVLISLMFVLMFVMGSCSEKSKMTGLCEKGDELACRWVEKNNLCKGGEGGNPGACTWLNNRKECENGSKTHCFDFAVSLYNERMLDLSKEYFLKSLLQYSQEEREGIFTAFLEENKVNFRVENLMYFWDVGCDAGLGYHCSELFDILKERGLSSDYARMINLAEKGCSANFCQSCLDLGHIYGDGKRGVPEDTKKALEFYKKGCDSCNELVVMGTKFHSKIYSCQLAGLLYFKGGKFGIPQNKEQSLKYYKIGYGIDAEGSEGVEEQRQVILNQMIEITCGNGVVDEGEICDGGEKICSEVSPKYWSGVAPCQKGCSEWDISKCITDCSDSDKFCHSHDGLNWSDASSDDMIWDDAVDYCENLGGRLPTISELRTLIQNCPATETGGACKVTNDCLHYGNCSTSVCGGCYGSSGGRYSKLGDTSWFWSSSERSGDANHAWYVNFYHGSVSYNGKNFLSYVRCVSGALTENKFESIKNEPSAEPEKTSEVPAPSFDCKKATTFVEKTICGNATLAGYDKELAEEYKAILKNPEKKTEVRDSQRNWIKERNTCKDEECLINSYKKRLGDLKGMR